jgi:hypothetical protein
MITIMRGRTLLFLCPCIKWTGAYSFWPVCLLKLFWMLSDWGFHVPYVYSLWQDFSFGTKRFDLTLNFDLLFKNLLLIISFER